MKVLSFVVPAYNSEHFLDKGIPSMLHPEILDKLEIIIVNDGSTDGTAAAAEKYCALYPDTVRLISQVNKGHGGALNTGCAAAQGKYLKVIDADDWVVTENLPAFIQALENCESDVVLTHFNIIDISDKTITPIASSPSIFSRPLTMDEFMVDWRNFYCVTTFHGITYRTDFYHSHNNQLTEHIFYEDNEYATIPCCRATSITPLNIFIYVYRIGDVNQSISTANRVKRLHHISAVITRMANECNHSPKGPGRRLALQKTQAVSMMYLTTALLAHPNRRTGRHLASTLIAQLQAEAPDVFLMLRHKYFLCLFLHYIHINQQTWEFILNSKMANAIRKIIK